MTTQHIYHALINWFTDLKAFFMQPKHDLSACFAPKPWQETMVLYALTVLTYFLGQLWPTSISTIPFILRSTVAFGLYLPILILILAVVSQGLLDFFHLKPSRPFNMPTWFNFYGFWMPLLGLQFCLSHIHILLSPWIFLLLCYVGYQLLTQELQIAPKRAQKMVVFAGILPMALILSGFYILYSIQMAQYKAITQGLYGGLYY